MMARAGGRGRGSTLRQGDASATRINVPGGAGGVLAVVVLCLASTVWITLGMTTFFVGPAEWDDNQYCDIASMPRPSSWVPNRYVHIWTLRTFYFLMESRPVAAGLYSALTVVGMMWIGFSVGRRMSGPGCGLIAALLMPLYPVLLKYMTVPYCDEPMILWSGVALVCALLASDAQRSGTRWTVVAACGLFCFMSVKCKETGLAVVPAVALVLWSCDHRMKVVGQWLGGVLAGCLALTLLDAVIMHDGGFMWRWSSYFPHRTPNPNPTVRTGMEYVELLSSRQFLAFSLLGVGGALLSFRENRVVRAVAVWLFAVLLFQSLISARYKGIQALDRYAVGVGVPLVILGAHWIVKLWQRSPPADDRKPVALAVVLAILVGMTVYGIGVNVASQPDPKSTAWRLYFFLVPLTTIALFAIPWLGSRRWLTRASLVVLVAMTATLSVSNTLRYTQRSEAKLEPWVKLAHGLDDSGAKLVTWKNGGKPFSKNRIARRCRALSAAPPEQIEIRAVESLDEVADDEWVVTDVKWWRSSTREQQELRAHGWQPFISAVEGRSGFVVCRRVGAATGG